MNLTLTCKCGKKFTLNLQDAGKEVACPGCGKRAKVPPLKKPSAPISSMELDRPEAPKPFDEMDDEIKLQELPAPPRAAPVALPAPEEAVTLKPLDLSTRIQAPATAKAAPPAIAEDDDDDAGYGIDKEQDASGIENGTGVYSTLSTISLDEEIPCIAYGARGNWVLAGQGSDVLVINMKTKKPTKFFEEHEAPVTSVALSATEPLALSADEDGMMFLWDAATMKRKKRFTAHDDAVAAVALAPNGKFAASGGEDSYIYLWDFAAGKRRDLEHNDWEQWEEVPTYVAFSRDSKRLLAGGSGGRVSVWSVETGERIKRYAGLDLPISCLRLSDEGGKLTAATHPVREAGTNYLVICHWDTKTGKPKDRFNIAIDSTPCCVIPDRNGSRIIIAGGGRDPWMGVWGLERGQCKHVYDDLQGSPISLAVSPLNNRVIAALHNEQIQLFGIEPF